MTRGCHNCSVDLAKYDTYEESPCATCPLAENHYHSYNIGLFDNKNTAVEDAHNVAQQSSGLTAEQEELLAGITGDLETFEAIKQACETQLMVTLSNVCLRIIKLLKRNPTTVGILLRKWQFPYMSYSDIGASMMPKCSKQNVLYHLKRAVQLFPELESLILTDTRFSGGRYALRTVAEQRRQNYIKDRLRQAIYGNDPLFKAATVNEVSALIDAPCGIPNYIVDFDLYKQASDSVTDEITNREE